jgi:hypothetical protein
MHFLSYAHDYVCVDEPERPLDASANAGSNHFMPVAQCLQHLP